MCDKIRKKDIYIDDGTIQVCINKLNVLQQMQDVIIQEAKQLYNNVKFEIK